ncbi:MAG: FGGY-family carbohydrate kinase [Gammaproteobacteria bacterium]|nr:FGGY-family carbohydrate kinase [Gammaproteobacteria bacterium]
MLSIGIDIGTSGIRAVIVDKNHCLLSDAKCNLPQSQPYYSKPLSSSSLEGRQIIGYSQDPYDWWKTFEQVISKLSSNLKLNHNLNFENITHLAFDGTSGTVLLCDALGKPTSEALMYNDQRSVNQASLIKQFAPIDTAAIGTTSGLAKLLWLYTHQNQHEKDNTHYALNQSDWLSGHLMGKYGISDYNNALKMGYDAQSHCWPDWLLQLFNESKIPSSILPQVFSPGQVIGNISSQMAKHFGFREDLKICAGTTDSTAAIIASGAKNIGDAVTSLGSSLVMKVISDHSIFDYDAGVYSQPYGKLWLVGGSSNSGGEVLKLFFSSDELSQHTNTLIDNIQSNKFSMLDLNYYPLSSPGERFPIQKSHFLPQLSPRPKNDYDFFQAILEGMSDIETMAYKKLVDLGAPYPKLVNSIGGGALNSGWRHIREHKLGVPVKMAEQQQAAAGAALLAQTTWHA